MKTRCTLDLRDRNQAQLAYAFGKQHLELLARDLGRNVDIGDIGDRNLAVQHFICSRSGRYFQSHVGQSS